MRYLLVVVSHGRSETLESCLDSFREHVSPLPAAGVLHHDLVRHGDLGISQAETALRRAHWLTWQMEVPARPIGFCRSSAYAWRKAAASPYDYVFWLEHDFRFVRTVDLRDLALVLDSDRDLAQMGLLRGPVNLQEVAAGGIVASRPGEFTARTTLDGDRELGWLEQTSYLTTNPSLMRRPFMAEHLWPDYYPSECEGRFGAELRGLGYRFGAWGDGSPWVDHIGVRTGFGY